MVIVWDALLLAGGFALAVLLKTPTTGSDKVWALAALAGLLALAFGYIAGRSKGYVDGYRLARTEVDPSEITSLIQLVIEVEKRQLRSQPDRDEIDDDGEGFERDLDYALEKNAELMRRLAR